MKLYWSWSPNPQKVRFALEELGLACQIVELDLFQGEQRRESFAQLNPMCRVPVIEDEGFVLWESNAILAYLGEREHRLWPADTRSRADALRWLFFEARHLADSIGNLWFHESVAPNLGRPADAESTARARTELEQPLTVLDQALSKRPWMLGNAFSLVDCCVGTQLAALSASRFECSRYPHAMSYLARIRERSGWQATRPRY